MRLLSCLPPLFLAGVAAAAVLVAACSGSTTSTGSPPDGSVTQTTDGSSSVDGGGGVTEGGLGAEPVAIDFSGVPRPSMKSCDGELTGTWDGEIACSAGIFEWIDSPPTSGCADFHENKVSGSVKVRYTFTEVNATRTLEGSFTENLDLPLNCTANQVKTCADVEAAPGLALYGARANPLPDFQKLSAKCTQKGQICNCDVTVSLTHEQHDFKSGYQIASAGYAKLANGDTFSFCPKGDALTLRTEILDLDNIFPNGVTYTLKKVQ